MDWIERLNHAVAYIEENLTEELDYERLGELACCSPYHFQRMFGYLAGMPLSEYVRRRRMSRAAAELQASGEKVITVALRYGYDSPTAFNRAFQSVHSFPPSKARESGVLIRSYPPISFQITIKGATQMDYRIEAKEAFRVVGVSIPLDQDMEKNFETVPKLWGRVAVDGTIARLCELANAQPAGVLGVSACAAPNEEWRYCIAVASTEPKGEFEEFTVPSATWAVFSGRGPAVGIQELQKRIASEWLPTSGYEYGAAPDIEVYLDSNPVDARYEVWIPVVKKA